MWMSLQLISLYQRRLSLRRNVCLSVSFLRVVVKAMQIVQLVHAQTCCKNETFSFTSFAILMPFVSRREGEVIQ